MLLPPPPPRTVTRKKPSKKAELTAKMLEKRKLKTEMIAKSQRKKPKILQRHLALLLQLRRERVRLCPRRMISRKMRSRPKMRRHRVLSVVVAFGFMSAVAFGFTSPESRLARIVELK